VGGEVIELGDERYVKKVEAVLCVVVPIRCNHRFKKLINELSSVGQHPAPEMGAETPPIALVVFRYTQRERIVS
jgi:hypothetical protein